MDDKAHKVVAERHEPVLLIVGCLIKRKVLNDNIATKGPLGTKLVLIKGSATRYSNAAGRSIASILNKQQQ